MRATTRFFIHAVWIFCLSAALASGQSGLVANAGPDQSGMFVGDTVNLTGAASVGATTYAWSIMKRPSGSLATLTNPTSVTPSFVPDRGGSYTVRLTVGNGITTAFDTVVIITANRPPTANAGADVTGTVGKAVPLSGLGSSDPDLNKLTYLCAVVTSPPASRSVLSTKNAANTSLTLDRPGTYVVELTVRDGHLSSAPDQVTVITTNSKPLGNAGP